MEFNLLRFVMASLCQLTMLVALLSAVDVVSLKDYSSPAPFRIITYDDVVGDVKTRLFEREGLEDFSQLVIDEPRQQIIVGARDHLVRLSLSDIEPLELTPWAPDDHTINVCLAKGQKQTDCRNFIRVILVHNNAVFACGTYAYTPLCSWRKALRLTDVTTWETGVAKCPFNPRQNSSYLMTPAGDFYIGTVTDFTGRDPAIYRLPLLGPAKRLRTAQYNSRWLNEPDFVSTYDIGDYVYFFFREAAVEYINCGKAIYSRVARICKNDVGGKVLLEDNWTTFVKARLNCSMPGSYPFYFSELQSTYYVEHEQLIYAVFSTSPNSIYGSAVCVYNLSAINEALNGPFKYQEHSHSAWNRVSNNLPHTCPAAVKQLSTNSQRHLVNVQKYQMMDHAVQPVHDRPTIIAEKQRYSHIVVDQVSVTQNSMQRTVDIVFLATIEGAVHKFALLPSQVNGVFPCLIEVIHLTSVNKPQPIKVIQLNHGSLIVGTSSRLFKVPVHRCNRQFTKLKCLGLNDPYCGWDSAREKCVPIGHPQIPSSCTDTNYPVDGRWSEWSPWERCYGDDLSTQQCQCRFRSCDSPQPTNQGLPCFGPRMQVINCSVDGRWSEWSSWSSCSVTDDLSRLEMRRRTCASPAPQHGGKPCIGDDTETRACTEIPTVDSEKATKSASYRSATDVNEWTAWTEWSRCSVKCGSGHQSRLRFRRTERDGGSKEKEHEMRACDAGKCPVHRKTSPWSTWHQFNTSADGSYLEERLRCVCRARVHDTSLLREPNIRTELRHCLSTGSDSCVRLLTSTVSPSTVPTTIEPATSPAMCPKCSSNVDSKTDRENNIIDKDLLSDGSYVPTSTPRTVDHSRSFSNRSLLYCDCRDLGPMRVCRRCSAMDSARYGTHGRTSNSVVRRSRDNDVH